MHAPRLVGGESEELADAGGERGLVESALTMDLRAALGSPLDQAALREDPTTAAALDRLAHTCYRAQLARRFHNDAVVATQRLRRNVLVRPFHLAGRAAMPVTFEMDDEVFTGTPAGRGRERGDLALECGPCRAPPMARSPAPVRRTRASGRVPRAAATRRPSTRPSSTGYPQQQPVYQAQQSGYRPSRAATAQQGYPQQGYQAQQGGYPQQQPVYQAQQTGYPQAYRPGGFAPSPAEWGSMNAAMAPPPNTTGQIEQVWVGGQRVSNRPLFNYIGIAVGAIGMIAVIILVMQGAGRGADDGRLRAGPDPARHRARGRRLARPLGARAPDHAAHRAAVGRRVSTLTSLFINTAAQQAFFDQTGDAQQAMTLGAVVVAPVVEEFFKGLGVLLLFLLRRQHFDGPVDGVVYAATVAAGFAFTENILYFAQNAEFVWIVFVMRGLLSPFAHLIFTACTGIAIGMAARSRKTTTVLLAFPVGLVGAMGLHALWNGSSMLGNFFVIFLVVQIPLFIAVVVLMVWLRRQEAEVVRARLGEYAQAGWFAPQEVFMLSSMRMRSQARTWAAGYGERAKQAMKEFQRDSTALAYLRQRQLTGRAELRASQSEHELLNEIQRDRHTFTVSAQGLIRQ